MSSNDNLAINGGDPAITTALPGRGSLGNEEKDAVNALFDEAIRSGNAIGYAGEQEDALCEEFSEYMGGGFTDAVNSGTNAVYVSLKALEIPPFTEVIVSAINDPGGVMPIPLIGCIPVIADTAPGSYNVGPEQVEELITPLTTGIVVAHIGGEPADIKGIIEIAEKHGLPVVEDCSQSHHATVDGRLVGTFGDVAAISTMFGKHHNSGGQGGLVFARDEEIYKRIRQSADRGKPFGLPEGSSNCIASLNSNSSEISAAINRAQLKKLPLIVEGKRRVAKELAQHFIDLPSIKIPEILPGTKHSYWWWRLMIVSDGITCSKDEYCEALAAEGVPLIPSYGFALPHKMDWFSTRSAFSGSHFPWDSPEYKGTMSETQYPTPNAIESTNTCFNLHIYESWQQLEIEQIAKAFRKVDAAYRRSAP